MPGDTYQRSGRGDRPPRKRLGDPVIEGVQAEPPHRGGRARGAACPRRSSFASALRGERDAYLPFVGAEIAQHDRRDHEVHAG